MRIAIYIEPWISQRAGIAVFTECLVREAEKSNTHEYVLIGSEEVDTTLDILIIPKWRLSFYNPLRHVAGGFVDLNKHKIDWLIDTAHYGTLGILKAQRKLLVVHDLTAINQAEYHRWSSVLAHKLWMRKSLRSSNKVVAVSNQTKNDLIKFGTNDKNLTSLYPSPRQGMQSPNSLQKSTGDRGRFFLCVGTIEPRKNHKTIIEAFDLYCKQGGEGDLFIVGDSGWKVNIDQLVSRSNYSHRIQYMGFVSNEDLLDLYRQALASVYVSYYEGFGFPILESMSQGCPVITSNLGSMKEIADGAAALVQPTSIKEIASAMKAISESESLRTKYQELGLQRASEFTWTKFLAGLESVIER